MCTTLSACGCHLCQSCLMFQEHRVCQMCSKCVATAVLICACNRRDRQAGVDVCNSNAMVVVVHNYRVADRLLLCEYVFFDRC